MNRFIWVIAGLVATTSLIVAVLSFSSARQSRQTAAELTRQQHTLESEIEQAHERLTKIPEAKTAAQITATQPKEVTAAPVSSSSPPPSIEFADLMRTNPAVADLFRQTYGNDLPFQYRRLYQRAHLSAEQISRFEKLMIEASHDRMELSAIAKEQGLAKDSPAVIEMRRRMEERVRNEQREVLGESGYQEMVRTDRLRPVATLMTSLGRLLTPTGNALTPQQGDQVLDILGNATGGKLTGSNADILAINTAEVLQHAQPILTPVQFEALQIQLKGVELQKLTHRYYENKNSGK